MMSVRRGRAFHAPSCCVYRGCGLHVVFGPRSIAVAADVQIPTRGQVTWCLSSATAQEFAAAGIALSAVAPATLDTSGQAPCARWLMRRNISQDLSSGAWALDGGTSFTRSEDSRILQFTNVRGELADRWVAARAAVGGEAPQSNEVASFAIGMAEVTVSPPIPASAGAVEARPIDTLLTEKGAAVFTKALGSVPVPVVSLLAAVAGRVDASSMLD